MNRFEAEVRLAEFVGAETVSTSETASFVDRICDLIDGPGVRIERWPENPKGGPEEQDARKVELLATCGPEASDSAGSGPRAGLVLSGHMDTVPADEPEWTSNPFEAKDAGDRWIGRGTCDMKGFLALAVTAFRTASAEKLRAPLILLFTSDEELGSLGAQRLAQKLSHTEAATRLPRACIVGEPTSLRVVHRHKGHYRLRLEVLGRPAHSGFPHRGENAIERVGVAIRALSELRERWATDPDRRDSELETPFQTLNLGTIAGGRAVNVVPDHCAVEIGIRPLPGVAGAELLGEVAAALEQVLPPNQGQDLWRLSEINDSPSLLTPPESAIHTRLCRQVGQNAPLGTSFASDAGVFQSLGMESVLFGPGSIEVAHKPDEFLPKDEFYRAGEILDSMIEEFCAKPDLEERR